MQKVMNAAELQRRFLIRQEAQILAEYDRAVVRLAEQNANYSAEEIAVRRCGLEPHDRR